MKRPLAVLGAGLHLPPARPVLDIARAHGADVFGYTGWLNVCHARDDEHPSTMGASALAQALDVAGVAAKDLRLVLFTGVSRDYVPSWSVATEVMRLVGAPGRCFGLDITAGCAATLSALDLIQAWLPAQGGGYAAVVAGERWSHTVDFADPAMAGLWSYGDSGGAIVVGMDVPGRPKATFLGAEFFTISDLNGQVIIPYGGTRHPQAPPDVNPHLRQLGGRVADKKQLTANYRRGYREAYEALRARFPVEPQRMICNQATPPIVGMFGELFGLQGRVVATGHRTGHLGGVDVVVALKELFDAGPLDVPVLMGGSTAYAFGTGFLVPPA